MNNVQFYSLLCAAIDGEFFDGEERVMLARKWLRQSVGVTPALVLKAAPELLAVAAEYSDRGHDCSQRCWRGRMMELATWLKRQEGHSRDLHAQGTVIASVCAGEIMISDHMMTLFRALSNVTFQLGILMRAAILERQQQRLQ